MGSFWSRCGDHRLMILIEFEKLVPKVSSLCGITD